MSTRQSRFPENVALAICLAVVVYLFWLRMQGKLR